MWGLYNKMSVLPFTDDEKSHIRAWNAYLLQTTERGDFITKKMEVMEHYKEWRKTQFPSEPLKPKVLIELIQLMFVWSKEDKKFHGFRIIEETESECEYDMP